MRPPHRLELPLLALLLASAHAGATPPASELYTTLDALDSAVFDSFNHCSEPAQLVRHGAYFDTAVEFYHDTGGVTFNRAAMLANTAAHACGKYIRQRVPGTLQVYPLPGHGALTVGEHRFCSTDGTRCEGRASFTMVWQQHDSGWQVTRVLSYGHRSEPTAP